jgi:hypothetical protein
MGWCVAQEYNKGAYQLITDPATLKHPHEQYVWADDDLPWWVRVLYGVAFLGLLAALTVFGLLL